MPKFKKKSYQNLFTYIYLYGKIKKYIKLFYINLYVSVIDGTAAVTLAYINKDCIILPFQII